jgi:phosphatidylglycerol:prolipoprotein diacylglycerol transferase
MSDWVGFPNLWNLKFEVSRITFEIFGFPVYWYALIIVTAFSLAIILSMRASKDFGIESESIIDLVLFAVPVSIILARLYFVAFNWSAYKNSSFLEIINIRNGGLAIYGGLIGAVIVSYIFAKHKKINILSLMDFALPYMVLAQGIGRWGNFVNQEAYGTTTTLPWGMTGSLIGNTPVHPTFLYESIWDIGLFFFLIWFRKRKKVEGEVFFLYMILYGTARLWIEPLRTDSLMLGSVRVSWFLALIFILSFSLLFVIRRKRAAIQSDEYVSTGSSEYGSVINQLKDEEHLEDEGTIHEEEKEVGGDAESE